MHFLFRHGKLDTYHSYNLSTPTIQSVLILRTLHDACMFVVDISVLYHNGNYGNMLWSQQSMHWQHGLSLPLRDVRRKSSRLNSLRSHFPACHGKESETAKKNSGLSPDACEKAFHSTFVGGRIPGSGLFGSTKIFWRDGRMPKLKVFPTTDLNMTWQRRYTNDCTQDPL